MHEVVCLYLVKLRLRHCEWGASVNYELFCDFKPVKLESSLKTKYSLDEANGNLT